MPGDSATCVVFASEKSKTRPNEPLEPIPTARKPRQIVTYDVATLPWERGKTGTFTVDGSIFQMDGDRSHA